MMQCIQYETGEVHESGRKILRCRRRGCDLIQLVELPGSRRIPRDCGGFPFWWEFGWWIEGWLRGHGITKARVEAVVGHCNCDERIEAANEAGSAAAKTLGLKE